MTIKTKSFLAQLICKHDYREGMLGDGPYFNLSGDKYTTICVKCGKIKGTRFVRNFDGS